MFLDEVGEIPLALQGKLLRALQEREFERVGDDRRVRVDLRVVAATHRDLGDEIKAGRFREDLCYRLGVFPIVAPPLRERRNDIGPLAEHFLERICTDLGREPMHLSKQQARHLMSHGWPGNIRELRNVIERAVILSTGTRARLDLAMPEGPDSPTDPPPGGTPPGEGGFVTDAEMREREKANVTAALRHADGRVWGPDGAAGLLGIKPSTLDLPHESTGYHQARAVQMISEWRQDACPCLRRTPVSSGPGDMSRIQAPACIGPSSPGRVELFPSFITGWTLTIPASDSLNGGPYDVAGLLADAAGNTRQDSEQRGEPLSAVQVEDLAQFPAFLQSAGHALLRPGPARLGPGWCHSPNRF